MTTSESRTEPEAPVVEMGYAARLPGCGCVVAAQMDRPEYASDVRRFKREHLGFTIDHLPAEEIRALPWGWPCEHMKAGAITEAGNPPTPRGVA